MLTVPCSVRYAHCAVYAMCFMLAVCFLLTILHAHLLTVLYAYRVLYNVRYAHCAVYAMCFMLAVCFLFTILHAHLLTVLYAYRVLYNVRYAHCALYAMYFMLTVLFPYCAFCLLTVLYAHRVLYNVRRGTWLWALQVLDNLTPERETAAIEKLGLGILQEVLTSDTQRRPADYTIFGWMCQLDLSQFRSHKDIEIEILNSVLSVYENKLVVHRHKKDMQEQLAQAIVGALTGLHENLPDLMHRWAATPAVQVQLNKLSKIPPGLLTGQEHACVNTLVEEIYSQLKMLGAFYNNKNHWCFMAVQQAGACYEE